MVTIPNNSEVRTKAEATITTRLRRANLASRYASEGERATIGYRIANADGSDAVIYGNSFRWASWGPDGNQVACLDKTGIQIVDLDSRKVVRQIPLERLLLETDAPDMTPEPYRGQDNEPAYLVEVARKVAAIKGVSVEEVAAVTTARLVDTLKDAQI